MLKNYFKVAWRSINRNKAYSIINVLGLALGISACIIIFLVVRNELTYDGFHKKSDRIYRVTLNAIDFNPCVSMAIAAPMRTDFPELENVSQVLFRENVLVKVGEQRFSEKGLAYVDEQFTSVFDYDWLAGDPKTALAEPNSAVLTQSLAQKYFGNTSPIGQVINIYSNYNLKVTGLIKDVPGNTHLPFQLLASMSTINENLKGPRSTFWWIMGGAYTYIVTPKNYDIQKIQKRIPWFLEKNWGKDLAKDTRLPLQPLKDIHFDQRYLNNTISPTTSRETYQALAAVALFIIIIVSINFINLATAQAIKRAKEVGVRKVMGSSRRQLIGQFLSETAVLVLIALALAIVATAVFLPKAAEWLNLKIDIQQLASLPVIGLFAGITIVLILLAGLYPAFVQSAFNPVDSFRNKLNIGSRRFTLRKSLVVVQFVISQILIAGTLIVAYQMDFFQNRDLGFNKDAVISFYVSDDKGKREVIQQQLAQNPGVKEVSFGSGAPSINNNFTSVSSKDVEIKEGVTEMKFVDEKFINLFQVRMLAGKPIEKNTKTEDDSVYNVVVNETLVNKLNIQDPQKALGVHITLNGDWDATITGVIADFQTESKHKKRRAMVLVYRSDDFFMASVKLQPKAATATIAKISKEWSALFPDDLFQYQFLDESIARYYQQEQKMYTAFKLFSAIAILIGCLGLYGLIAFAAAQRTKEIGIRKVLGASLFTIISLFTKEIAVLIAIAFVIAAPVAYYVMNNWLENFAYQVTIGAGIFFIALGASILIAAITIAHQAIKAAVANPVKSLRSE